MTRHPVRYIVVAAALVATLPPAALAGANPTPGRSGTDVLSGSEASGGDASAAMPATLQLAATRSLARDAGPAYRIDADGRGANPRHGLRLAFTPEGAQIAVVPEAASHGPRATNYELALRLERFGRGAGEPVHPTPPRIDGAWVEYDRGAGLREWFVNLPQGMEQGWTVTQRPAGDGPLMLELDTGRSPDRVDGERLAWSGLDYHGLVALDAEGRELPARWISDGARLRIEVDDTAAAYPLVIDPWLQQAKLTADDGAGNDQFGLAVALEGDTALVGARFANVDGIPDQGAVYVFTLDGETWSEQDKLTAEDGGEDDRFGAAVTLAGGTALVGAQFADVGVNDDQGAAYVFTRSGGTWSQQDKLTADGGVTGDQFGTSVALEGDTALVGAFSALVDGNPTEGAAYVFTRSGETWSQQDRLTSDDGAANDHFGRSVGLSGDTAVVGADLADVDGNVDEGAAYVFIRDNGTWNQQAKLTADDGEGNDRFGVAIALAGDTVLVGARIGPGENHPDQGAAYVFTRSGETWNQQAKLTADDGAQTDNFGFSVDLSGDTALVGAPVADIDGNAGQGAAYLFTRSGETWSQQTKLTANDGAQGDSFGRSVALAGNAALALVGAQQADVDGNNNRGAAYVLTGPLVPAALDVDFTSIASDGNGVFEPGEQVEAAPGWRNEGGADAFADGTLSNFAGPEGGSYDIVLDNVVYGPIPPGEIGSCRDSGTGCYQLDVQMTGPDRPARHWDTTVDEELLIGPFETLTHTWTLHLGDSFTDTPRGHLFYRFIETIFHNGITGGCDATGYCPGDSNTRAQMAAFVLRSFEGSDYVPPACEAGPRTFDDVPSDDQFCPWIEELARRGVASGCDADSYCPGDSITRAQMGVFLLRTLQGADYTPPECTGVFTDVDCPSLFADWIEDLATREITGGCTSTEYCPNEPQTRGQMAVFLTRTFGLLLYGP